MSHFVSNNGTLVARAEYSIHAGNRGHLYGDGLFETIRVISGKPVNLENHVKRLIEGMQVMGMKVPEEFSLSLFEREIHALLTANEITEGGKVRLSIDRKPGGTYLPTDNQVDYFIEAFENHPNFFFLNEKGLTIELYDKMKKQINILSPYKTKNCILYIMARLNAEERGVNDVLIQNDKMGIIESSSSNLFMASNGVLYTPGLDLGCLGGTMRMQIINLAIAQNIKVYECNISPQNLLAADEIFLTNAISGIQWVEGYRTKTYTNEISRQLMNYLNDKWN